MGSFRCFFGIFSGFFGVLRVFSGFFSEFFDEFLVIWCVFGDFLKIFAKFTFFFQVCYATVKMTNILEDTRTASARPCVSSTACVLVMNGIRRRKKNLVENRPISFSSRTSSFLQHFLNAYLYVNCGF